MNCTSRRPGSRPWSNHYFAAWQEASSVLARRERELAELRRSVKPKLVTIPE